MDQSIHQTIDRSIHQVQEICDRLTKHTDDYHLKLVNLDDSESEEDEDADNVDRIDTLEVEKELELNPPPAPSQNLLIRWIFPADIPQEIQLWRIDNIAIPLSYMMVGTFQGISGGVMTIFLLKLNATEAQQVSVGSLRALPSSFKILFGFISDTLPIFGYRRKSYMLMGWVLSSVSMFILACNPTPSIPLLSTLYFLFGFGFWFADVIADSLMAEKVRFEPESMKGNTQSLCYACRFFALMLSSICVTFALEDTSPTAIFYLMAFLPVFLVIPAVMTLKETKNIQVANISTQCKEIWSTICSRAVWQPLAFVYLYNVMQVGNGAWLQYLYTSLHFSNMQINSFMVAANIMVYLGVLTYKGYMLKWSWRSIFIMTGILNIFFSILQVLLILKVNRKMGISDYLFSFGDDAMSDFIAGIQFLPTAIMMADLCPKGSEGVSYAMFTSINNTGDLVASTLSTLMLGIWDVSKQALERNDLSGMINLTILTSVIQTAAMGFIGLLPKNTAELKQLNFSNRSKVGGAIFLGVTIVSCLFSIITSILNITDPRWMGGT